MINTGTLYFFCGKMASGKTTLAQSIAKQSGCLYELHYIDSSDARCKQQLLKRNADNPDVTPTDTIAMFEAMAPYFDPPTESEGFNLVLHQND